MWIYEVFVFYVKENCVCSILCALKGKQLWGKQTYLLVTCYNIDWNQMRLSVWGKEYSSQSSWRPLRSQQGGPALSVANRANRAQWAGSRTRALYCTQQLQHAPRICRRVWNQVPSCFPQRLVVILVLRGRKESRLIENEAVLRRGGEEAELSYRSRHVETSVAYFEYIRWEWEV